MESWLYTEVALRITRINVVWNFIIAGSSRRKCSSRDLVRKSVEVLELWKNCLFGRDCLENKDIYIHLGLTVLRLAVIVPEPKRGPIRNKIIGDISGLPCECLTFQNFCPPLCLAMYSARKIASPFEPPQLPTTSHDHLLSLITSSLRPSLMTTQSLGDSLKRT
jgi:hypothetical protein